MKLGQRRMRSDDDSAPNRRLDVAERDAQRVDVIAAANPRNLASLSRLHSAPSNGSRLSCGRNARWRKAVGRQKERLAGEATQFLPTCERPAASSAC